MIIKSGDLFISALRKCEGAIAEGETPTKNLLHDARRIFNVMIDAWSRERTMCFCSKEQNFTWPANTASQTLGPTGDMVGTRPVKILDTSYFKDASGNVNTLTPITESMYRQIVDPTIESTYPEYLWENPTSPDTTITLYAVPSSSLDLYIVSVLPLVQVDDLITDLYLPEGYARAFIFNLACDIAPELGVKISANTARIAMVSKRDLKAGNDPMDVLEIPGFLTNCRSGYDINMG